MAALELYCLEPNMAANSENDSSEDSEVDNRVLSLVDRCVWMKVCEHSCDVLDSRVLLRIIL